MLYRADYSPAEKITIKVDFIFYIVPLLISPERFFNEFTKNSTSAKDSAIIDNIINVFFKFMSSARILPRGRVRSCAFSDLIILY